MRLSSSGRGLSETASDEVRGGLLVLLPNHQKQYRRLAIASQLIILIYHHFTSNHLPLFPHHLLLQIIPICCYINRIYNY